MVLIRRNGSTTVEEDKAYCLLEVFNIHRLLIYGEGKERAFIGLQDEIHWYSDSRGFGQGNLLAWTLLLISFSDNLNVSQLDSRRT